MKKIALLFLLALPLCGCEDKAVSEGRATYKAYFEYILKDPDSFKVYKETYTKDGKYTVNWILDYGAKNSFGAMVRETATFNTVGTTIFIDGETYELEDLK